MGMAEPLDPNLPDDSDLGDEAFDEALDGAFQRFEHFERRMDNLESQLESMDVGREVPPDLAAEIDALQEDERINDELARLKSQLGTTAQNDANGS